jgi:hypothetical protein
MQRPIAREEESSTRACPRTLTVRKKRKRFSWRGNGLGKWSGIAAGRS